MSEQAGAKAWRVWGLLRPLTLMGLALSGAALVAACGSTSSQLPAQAAKPAAGTPATGAALLGASCKSRHAGALTRLDEVGAGSTLVLASQTGAEGRRTLAFVADEDDRAIHVLDVDSRKELASTPLDGRPSQLVMLSDGRLVVGIRDRAKLVVLEPGAGDAAPQPLCAVSTPPEPVGLAVTPNQKRLLVTSAWGRRLSVFDGAELKPQFAVELGREPRAVVASRDSKRAFIAHAVGGEASVVELDARKPRRILLEERMDHEIEELRTKLRTELSAGKPLSAQDRARLASTLQSAASKASRRSKGDMRRTSCQLFALTRSMDSDRIYAPQVLVDPGDAENRTPGYGDENVQTELPSVAVIDGSNGQALPSSLRVNNQFAFANDESVERCILPRAAAVDAASGSLLVTCFGTDVVVAYDANSADPASAEKRRWRVAAGPSGVAVDPHEHRAVVWSQFDRTLNVIPLAGPELELTQGEQQEQVARLELAPNPDRQLSVAESLGRSLFHATGDNRISKDGRACASCHPDGRDDGLVWATPNGPRRTKLLAGSLADTAPYSWDGDNARLRDHLADTFERLSGVGGLRSVELRALVAYVESLAPPAAPPPKLDDPKVKRGEALFASEQVGCAECHKGASFTDNEVHDVKSKTRADREAKFNTPSLRFLAGRAPYYHDGRFASLRDLLANVDGDMGHTKHLSDDDLAALEAYLMQL